MTTGSSALIESARTDHFRDRVQLVVEVEVAAVELREAEGARQTHSLGYADRLLDRYKVWHA